MDPLNLNIDIENHDASRPIMPQGEYAGVITASAVVPSKNSPGNFNWMITMSTSEVVQSTKGTPINPGYKMTRYLPLQASEKQKEAGMENSFKDQIALTVDAIFGTSQGNRPAFTQELVTQATGKDVKAAVVVRAADGAFPESNDLARFLPQS